MSEESKIWIYAYLGDIKALQEIEKEYPLSILRKADNRGSTPLHWAAFGGQLELVIWLVEYVKSDVNAKNNDGCTPLFFACEMCHIEVVKWLVIEAGADVNAKDGIYEHTPLHRVCWKGQLKKTFYSEELLIWLIVVGKADLFAKDRFNNQIEDVGKLDSAYDSSVKKIPANPRINLIIQAARKNQDLEKLFSLPVDLDYGAISKPIDTTSVKKDSKATKKLLTNSSKIGESDRLKMNPTGRPSLNVHSKLTDKSVITRYRDDGQFLMSKSDLYKIKKNIDISSDSDSNIVISPVNCVQNSRKKRSNLYQQVSTAPIEDESFLPQVRSADDQIESAEVEQVKSYFESSNLEYKQVEPVNELVESMPSQVNSDNELVSYSLDQVYSDFKQAEQVSSEPIILHPKLAICEREKDKFIPEQLEITLSQIKSNLEKTKSSPHTDKSDLELVAFHLKEVRTVLEQVELHLKVVKTVLEQPGSVSGQDNLIRNQDLCDSEQVQQISSVCKQISSVIEPKCSNEQVGFVCKSAESPKNEIESPHEQVSLAKKQLESPKACVSLANEITKSSLNRISSVQDILSPMVEITSSPVKFNREQVKFFPESVRSAPKYVKADISQIKEIPELIQSTTQISPTSEQVSSFPEQVKYVPEPVQTRSAVKQLKKVLPPGKFFPEKITLPLKQISSLPEHVSSIQEQDESYPKQISPLKKYSNNKGFDKVEAKSTSKFCQKNKYQVEREAISRLVCSNEPIGLIHKSELIKQEVEDDENTEYISKKSFFSVDDETEPTVWRRKKKVLGKPKKQPASLFGLDQATLEATFGT